MYATVAEIISRNSKITLNGLYLGNTIWPGHKKNLA
jgi:hypothetical protein